MCPVAMVEYDQAVAYDTSGLVVHRRLSLMWQCDKSDVKRWWPCYGMVWLYKQLWLVALSWL